MKLYEAIAHNDAIIKRGGSERSEYRQEDIKALLPSGSGFDDGTAIESVSDTKIVLKTSFHHMDSAGGYDGRTFHKVIVIASLAHGITIRVTGRDKREIKDYIAEVFHDIMLSDFTWR